MTEGSEKLGEEKKEVAADKQTSVISSKPLNDIVLVGFACFVFGFLVGGMLTSNFFGGGSGVTTTLPGVTTTIPSYSKLNVVVLNDKRCSQCVSGMQSLLAQLETLFPDMEVKSLDYGSSEGKQLYNSLSLKYLPVILFDERVEEADNYDTVSGYLEQKGSYLSLRIGADFDPNAEICDNGVDDNGDGKVDCDDPTCGSEWVCMEKLEKPVVELFVMSHCPYGTQMEKGILPVVELLKDKIDFTVKFCSYAMHGKTELDEQLTQYCIQKDFNDKYLSYLRCFLEAGKSAECVESTGVDKAALASCISAADTAYKVTEKYNDKNTWLSGYYPLFPVYDDDNERYGITGSPGLVINGVVARANRDPASLLEAICLGFENPPEECSQTLSSTTPSAGFGWEGSGSNTDASCE
ncbi:MAG: hypothetical protein JW778_07645 [Candidatus Altiarchaeota archaeon]|nr:hypothetical protein [Candidatus Altiarchaeota archaeon]